MGASRNLQRYLYCYLSAYFDYFDGLRISQTQEKYFEKVTEVNGLKEQTDVCNEKLESLIREREGLTLEISVVKNELSNLLEQLNEEKGVKENLSLDLEVF